MRKSIGQFSRAVRVVFPAENLIDDIHVAEEIGNAAMMGLAFDAIEQDGAPTVQLFLNSRDLSVRIDLFVGLYEVAFLLQPFDSTP